MLLELLCLLNFGLEGTTSDYCSLYLTTLKVGLVSFIEFLDVILVSFKGELINGVGVWFVNLGVPPSQS